MNSSRLCSNNNSTGVESMHECVKDKRFVLCDNPPEGNFMVLMTQLTAEDGGIYRCVVDNASRLVSTDVQLKINTADGRRCWRVLVWSTGSSTYAFIPMAVFGVVPFVYMKCKRKISVSAAPSRKTTAPSATPEPAVYENDLTTTSQDEVPSNTTAPESVYQSLNPNIMVQDPVYHQLNPNTMVQYPVYQSLNPNTMVQDPVYHQLNPNTIVQYPVYQHLNPKTMVQNSVYHQLNPDAMVQDPVYQHLNPNTMVQNSVYHQLNPNTMVHDPVNQCLNRV
ncbi:uncharacterized protein LOC125298373 isoform X1 [Alosa alosa]|uniref:uncharacterized protein LOC125298373 isoform X1 n=1 Tax=Alosa alosa TaxID=278164 RepID=UPI0020154169|nr:uncharacterized protein LOC125298373 isoform X1 [Alosa alosa]